MTGIQESVVESERRMRGVAEESATGFRQVLLEIVEAIAPELLERHLQDPPARWPHDRWPQHVAEILILARKRLGNVDALTRSLKEQVAAKDAEIEQLAQNVQQLRAELERRSAEKLQAAQAQMRLPVVDDTLSASHAPLVTDTNTPAPQPATTFNIPNSPPQGWTFSPQGTYKIDATPVCLLGKTGRCSRPWLAHAVGAILELASGRGGTLTRCVNRCEKSGWIEIIRAKGAWAKAYPTLVRLTDVGKRLYRDLLGEDAVTSDLTRLIEGHPPDGTDHAVLCVAAANQFERLGLEVRVQPPAIKINQHVYEPDLWVNVPGDEDGSISWLVECERAMGPSRDGHAAKWNNAISVQGSVFIVAPDAGKRDTLIAEVQAVGRPCRVYATEVGSLRSAQTVDDIWSVVRELN